MSLKIFHRILSTSVFFLAALLICTSNFAWAYEHECGTMRVFRDIIKNKKYPKTALAKGSPESEQKCGADSFYDSVYTIETAHIQVFYVLKGPHATTKAFADSTAASMEAAWDFYVNKLKMREPKGTKISNHYLQKVKDGLYPIEIIDLEQYRDTAYILEKSFGVTLPFDNSTQIFLDNDFYYGALHNGKKENYFIKGNDTCAYDVGYIPLYNRTHNFYYTNEWAKGIRLTSFHEFYHAVQLRYLSLYENFTFWFEASATGFEEVTNPEIDDYISYLPYIFYDLDISLSNTEVNNYKQYGASALFLYLYNKVSKGLDKSIWENFSKAPTKTFEEQLATSLKQYKLDADSIFHDFTVLLSLSGNRSEALAKKDLISNDQPQWPTALFDYNASIKPNLISLTYEFDFVPDSYIQPDLTDFTGKASAITFKDNKATIHKILSNKTLDSLTNILSSSDSVFWIFSRLGESEAIPVISGNTSPHAFPVPWKNGPLCFAPLPRDKKFIEIRTRRGDLISQEKYDGTSYCLQEDKVKSMMAPGIYRFRVGNKGKTTSFMVIY